MEGLVLPVGISEESLHADLDAILLAYVQAIDPAFTVREGQTMMAHDALASAIRRGEFVGVGPCGLGKASVLLSVAMLLHARLGERTLVSTMMKSLMGQLLTKDGPAMSAAVEKVTGVHVDLAAFKGVSNYVCLAQMRDVLALENSANDRELGESPSIAKITKVGSKITAAQARRSGIHAPVTMTKNVYKNLVNLDEGDRNEVEKIMGDMLPDDLWSGISTTSSECAGETSCPLAEQCLMLAARRDAKQAGLVVTNHTMLAIQAVNAIPVALGGKVGHFEHLMCDETHGLVPELRNQASASVSVTRVKRAAELVWGLADAPWADETHHDGLVWSGALETALRTSLGGGTERDCTTDVPMDVREALESVRDWALAAEKEVSRMVGKGAGIDNPPIEVRRTISSLAGLRDDIDESLDEAARGARWIERSDGERASFFAWKYGRLDVAGLARRNLWSHLDHTGLDALDELDPDEEEIFDEEGTCACARCRKKSNLLALDRRDLLPEQRLSLTFVSGTMPRGFCRDAGIFERRDDQTPVYPSPFDVAYGNTRCYVPHLDAAELARLFPGRSMDTTAHKIWAGEQMREAFLRNGGRGLVIAASRANMNHYVRVLTDALAPLGIAVYSQGEGTAGLDATIARWRADETSVLVGVKSVATGVDAPGPTNSLVVIDRPGRARKSFFDDARVAAIMERTGMNQWAADVEVYVDDATQGLEQAVSRLVRDANDFGFAMILDPRLDWNGPFGKTYHPQTTNRYIEALAAFRRAGVVTNSKESWNLLGGKLDPLGRVA